MDVFSIFVDFWAPQMICKYFNLFSESFCMWVHNSLCVSAIIYISFFFYWQLMLRKQGSIFHFIQLNIIKRQSRINKQKVFPIIQGLRIRCGNQHSHVYLVECLVGICVVLNLLLTEPLSFFILRIQSDFIYLIPSKLCIAM